MAMIVGYLPDGAEGAPNFKYLVEHHNVGRRFFYTEDMVKNGKELLKVFYERET